MKFLLIGIVFFASVQSQHAQAYYWANGKCYYGSNNGNANGAHGGTEVVPARTEATCAPVQKGGYMAGTVFASKCDVALGIKSGPPSQTEVRLEIMGPVGPTGYSEAQKQKWLNFLQECRKPNKPGKTLGSPRVEDGKLITE